MGVRVCPWIIPQSELASTLVAQNLGICLHVVVDQSRKFLFMGYPSEPLVAECAAQCMNWDKIKLEDLIYPLIGLIRKGVVEGGYRSH